MSTGAWIFAASLLWVIAMVYLIPKVRSTPHRQSDAIDRLIASATRSTRAAKAPVEVDWTNREPVSSFDYSSSPAAIIEPGHDDMPIRTIGTPQPGDEPMKSEQQAATRVAAQELQRQQGNTLAELDILRKTRAARGGAGSVRVPASLAAPIIIPGSDDDVERRG
jgi:hypothetical protein